MKKYFFIIIFFTLNTISASESIKISVGEWAPYISKSLPDYGVASKIVSEAFLLEGIKVNYVFLPWKRAFIMAKDNDVDASLLWVITDEREEQFLFSDIVITGKAVFFHQKNFPFDWTDIRDLAKYKFGGLLSASYPWVEECKSLGIELDMVLAWNEEQNFTRLLYERIDLFSLDLLVGSYLLLNEFSLEERNKVTYHKKVIEEWNYRLIFSRYINSDRNAELITKFNSGLSQLISSGRYDEILSIYLIK